MGRTRFSRTRTSSNPLSSKLTTSRTSKSLRGPNRLKLHPSPRRTCKTRTLQSFHLSSNNSSSNSSRPSLPNKSLAKEVPQTCSKIDRASRTRTKTTGQQQVASCLKRGSSNLGRVLLRMTRSCEWTIAETTTTNSSIRRAGGAVASKAVAAVATLITRI